MEKKYNFKEQQVALEQLWLNDKIYQFSRENREHKNYFGLSADIAQERPIYNIDTPPPTVSGTLHIGHIFSYTHTDFIARYQRLSNKNVFYPFGFDDNGLPTEKYVEKKCKVSAHKLGRTAFIDLCLKETQDVEHQFQQLWQAIGLSADWELTYATISPEVRKISQESFIRLLKKGYIYRQ